MSIGPIRKKKLKQTLSPEFLKAYRENEYSANRQMVFACLFAGVLLSLIWIGYLTRIFVISDLVFLEMNIVIPIAIVLLFTPLTLIKTSLLRKTGFKYYIVLTFLLAIVVMAIFAPKHMILGYAIPIILVNHYYNPKMGRIIFGVTLAAMLLAMMGGMFLGEYDPNLLSGQIDSASKTIYYMGEATPFADDPAGRYQYLTYLMSRGENRFLAAIGYYYLARATIVTIIFFISNALNVRTSHLFTQALETYFDSEKTKSELAIASEIQQSSLPTGYYMDDKVEIIGQLTAAKEVGGDFYDYISLDQTHIALVIGDVSGKGIPAAMFMMRALTCIKSLLLSGESPASILAKANSALCKGNSNDMFVTCFLGILNTENGELRFANAGHNPPVVGHNRHYATLKCAKGFILGGLDSAIVAKDEVAYLKPGDALLLYTDGVTEAKNEDGELFGELRLLSYLNKRDFNSLIQIHKDLDDELLLFRGNAPQADDITYLFLHFLKGRSPWVEHSYSAEQNSVAEAMDLINGFGEDIKLRKKDLFNVLTIADEILSNIVKFAYPDRKGDFYIRLRHESADSLLTLTFIDSGDQFNQLAAEEKGLEGDVSNRPEGGLGILIVKNLATDYSYTYLNGKNIINISIKVVTE